MARDHKSPDHDARGKFKKGNRAAALANAEIREFKGMVRKEIVECAHSLTRPWGTLKEELEDKNISRYQYLVNVAVAERNTKVITWITEMAIGRPKQITDETVEGEEKYYIPVTKEHQEEIIKLVLGARMNLHKNETKKEDGCRTSRPSIKVV